LRRCDDDKRRKSRAPWFAIILGLPLSLARFEYLRPIRKSRRYDKLTLQQSGVFSNRIARALLKGSICLVLSLEKLLHPGLFAVRCFALHTTAQWISVLGS
jgi:hypothetical protein